MTDDCLKLTCYFGERHRDGGDFVADRLLDIYQTHGVTTSIMLRGVEGFGLTHHLRSDQSLTLSEDLPVVTVAVDTRPRIEALLDDVTAVNGIGLVTLERARLISGDLASTGEPASSAGTTKLTVYLGRQDRVRGVPAYVTVCELLQRAGFAGAIVLLGVDGTVNGVRRRATFFGRNTDVPTMVIAVGPSDSATAALPDISALLPHPLISVERVQICNRDGRRFGVPRELPGTDEHGMARWQKLSVFASEAAQYDGQPMHRALTRHLREAGSSGVTTLRGIWGFHGDHASHGDRPLRVTRRVPTLTLIVDTPEQTATMYPVVDEVSRDHGLVTSEIVPALHARSGDQHQGGLGLSDPWD